MFLAVRDPTPRLRDTIRDFEVHDALDFSSFDADPARPGRQPLASMGDRPFGGEAGELVRRGDRLLADADGDRRADFALTVTGAAAIEHWRIIL